MRAYCAVYAAFFLLHIIRNKDFWRPATGVLLARLRGVQLQEVLADNNLRVTQPRLLVWEVLSDAHLTAQEISEAVNELDDSVNVSSVYRTLTLFAELELARETKFGEEGSRWERAHSDEMIHLVCEVCNNVQHHSGAAVKRLRNHLASGHGFTASNVNVVVNGTCADCASRSRPPTQQQ